MAVEHMWNWLHWLAVRSLEAPWGFVEAVWKYKPRAVDGNPSNGANDLAVSQGVIGDVWK
jgi:hypothetical protein